MKKCNRALIFALAAAMLATTAVPAYAAQEEPAVEAFALDPDELPMDPVEQDKVKDFVSRLYTVVLGRPADPAGLEAWTKVLKNKTDNGAGVAKGFVDSDEFKSKQMSNREYIEIMYKTFLDRSSDEGGMNAWLKVMDDGMSRMFVFKGFVESNEFTKICERYGIIRGMANLTAPMDQNENMTKFVARCYKVFLGRGADPDGLNGWTNAMLNGSNNAKQVAYGFVMSPEFQNKNLSNEDYVRTMYQGLFDRGADPTGLDTWVGILEAGNSRESVYYGFADSTEFRNLARSFNLSGDWQGTPVYYKKGKQLYIDTLMQFQRTWMLSRYDAQSYNGYFKPGYTMMDMDLDGEPELIVTKAGGSMHNAPTDVYKIGKDVLTRINVDTDYEDFELQDPGLYYDTATGEHVYLDERIFIMRFGQTYDQVFKIYFDGNVITSQVLFSKERGSDVGYINQQECSAGYYQQQLNAFRQRMQKKSFTNKFVSYEDMTNADYETRCRLIGEMYEDWSCTK